METPNDTSPDDLMKHFHGRSLKSIVIFTLVVHAVVIFGTSIPYLLRVVGAADTAKLSDEERKTLAVKEATSKLREIAEQYGLQPQQLSDQLSGRGTPASTADAPADPPVETPPASDAAPATTPQDTPADAPKSAIEQQLQKAEPGPDLPPVDEAVDLFK